MLRGYREGPSQSLGMKLRGYVVTGLREVPRAFGARDDALAKACMYKKRKHHSEWCFRFYFYF